MDNIKDFIREIEDVNLIKDNGVDNISLKINDQMKDQKKNNHLVIFNANGDVIGETYNKVVSSGKVETIETMFRVYSISDKYGIAYDRPDNRTNPRWISTFGIGSGGAPLSEGNNPYIVNANDTELLSPSIFRKDNTNVGNTKYWDNFRKKDFSSVYLNWDKNTDDIYALLVCELDYNDCKGQTINEIGLYNCNHILDSNGQITGKEKFTLYAKANMVAINKSPLDNQSAFKIAYKVFI